MRGRADLVLPAGDDGPGAAALVRPDGADMFGFGSREAVLRALAADPADAPVYGSPADADDLADAIAEALDVVATVSPRTSWSSRPATSTRRGRSGVAAYAHGWEVVATRPDGAVDLRPSPPLT